MRQADGNGLCAYGSGLLSSYSELSYAIESDTAQRFPLRIEWVINQHFEIDHFQPLYFIVHNFDELYEQMAQLESYLCAGKLDNVSPGEPGVSDIDLASFLHAQID